MIHRPSFFGVDFSTTSRRFPDGEQQPDTTGLRFSARTTTASPSPCPTPAALRVRSAHRATPESLCGIRRCRRRNGLIPRCPTCHRWSLSRPDRSKACGACAQLTILALDRRRIDLPKVDDRVRLDVKILMQRCEKEAVKREDSDPTWCPSC